MKRVMAYRRGLAVVLLGMSAAVANASPAKPLLIEGYQMYTNLVTVSASDPTVLEVKTGGEGGLSSLGKMRSWSDDQQGDLVTGALSAHYTFEDKAGNKLFMSANGGSTIEPDGRFLLSGKLKVTGGTGPFRMARGVLNFEGWARTIDQSTGAGISLIRFDGEICGTKIEPAKPFKNTETGGATFVPPDFVYEGTSNLSHLGKCLNTVENTAGPFNGAFVGIVDGKIALCWSYEGRSTFRDGSSLNWSGLEIVHFNIVTAPDGSPAPDFTTPSIPEIYQTVEGGSGRLRQTQAVMFEGGLFTPVGPNKIAAEIEGVGFISR